MVPKELAGRGGLSPHVCRGHHLQLSAQQRRAAGRPRKAVNRPGGLVILVCRFAARSGFKNRGMGVEMNKEALAQKSWGPLTISIPRHQDPAAELQKLGAPR